MRQLPSLNALRTFEAAARHMNFTRAADELGVTQTAVSHQIKALEAYLELSLFRRSNNVLLLTDQGDAYFQSLKRVFDLLVDATSTLLRTREGPTLTIGVMPSFGMRWLIPHLPEFQKYYADINVDVRLTMSNHAGEFARAGLDAAILAGTGWPGYNCTKLLPIKIFPVCSPYMIDGRPPLQSPGDLAKHRLLRVSTAVADDWRIWLNAVGLPNVDTSQGPQFDSYSYAWQAAIEGVGVAIGREHLIEPDLDSGRLVRPFRRAVATNRAWFLVAPNSPQERPEFEAFRCWISAAAAQDACEAPRTSVSVEIAP